MTIRNALTTAALLLFCALGGLLASLAHLPMPFMLGGLAASALAVALFQHSHLSGYKLSTSLRSAFVALIGVMIGTQVTRDLLGFLPLMPIVFLALSVFILAAHMGNFWIFQKIGGMDRPTAFYSGTPGGLMESILFGEQAGADIRILTIQQFLRIIVVVTVVPTGLSLWLGHPVGSAAGPVQSEHPPLDLLHFVVIMICAAVGLVLAQRIKIPAAHLVGPMILTAALTLSGLIEIHLPFWMIATAQVVIGASLGLRFTGITLRMLARTLWLSLISVGYMIIIGSIMAAILTPILGVDFLVMFISFAPGGVTEMSLIALSLAASPALVSLHHILRILMTVMEVTFLSKKLGLR